MDHVRRQLQLRHMLLVIDHPGDLRVVEAIFVDEHLPDPHAGRHRIGAHADALAFQVLGHLDASLGADEHARMMEAPDDEDRQRHERRAIGAGDDIGGRRQLAHVELDVADHPAERADLRLHRDELGLDAFDLDAAVADRRGVRMFRDRHFQMYFARHAILSWEAPRHACLFAAKSRASGARSTQPEQFLGWRDHFLSPVADRFAAQGYKFYAECCDKLHAGRPILLRRSISIHAHPIGPHRLIIFSNFYNSIAPIPALLPVNRSHRVHPSIERKNAATAPSRR
jgi:hypothetical protein